MNYRLRNDAGLWLSRRGAWVTDPADADTCTEVKGQLLRLAYGGTLVADDGSTPALPVAVPTPKASTPKAAPKPKATREQKAKPERAPKVTRQPKPKPQRTIRPADPNGPRLAHRGEVIRRPGPAIRQPITRTPLTAPTLDAAPLNFRLAYSAELDRLAAGRRLRPTWREGE